MTDKETIKKYFNDYLNSGKVDGDKVDFAFVYMAKMKGRLSIMQDIVDDLAYARYNNTGKVAFEMDNLIINVKGFAELINCLVDEINSEVEDGKH
jgi:hypothetical protein